MSLEVYQVCIDRDLKNTLWRYESPVRVTSKGALLRDGEVLVGTTEGEIVSLRLDTGKPAGTVTLEGRIRCLGGTPGLLLAGTQEGMLYVRSVEP